VPVALSKIFRHSCIYVRTDAGIETPQDLRGKRVGTTQLGSTAVIFMNGILQHEYGVMMEDIQWFIGGLTTATQRPLIPLKLPGKIKVDYYRRTGIFPIMHTVALRDDIYREHPWAARSVYRAFCEARDLAVDGLYDTDALRLSLPWLIHHVEETWRVLGKDFWAYGLEPNRPTLQAIGQYVYEQGFSPRIVSPDELFAPNLE
jgi:4,5-dihydroxyphthalate decarboxylase